MALKSLKLKEPDLPPKTIGQHVKKRRLELKLTQKEASARIGVTPATALNWENGLSQPKVEHLPAIRDFLGYDPDPSPQGSIADRLRRSRQARGWSQRRAAQESGVDPSTWSAWEAGGTIIAKAHRALVARFVGLPEAEVHAVLRQQWNDSHRHRTPAMRARVLVRRT